MSLQRAGISISLLILFTRGGSSLLILVALRRHNFDHTSIGAVTRGKSLSTVYSVLNSVLEPAPNTIPPSFLTSILSV